MREPPAGRGQRRGPGPTGRGRPGHAAFFDAFPQHGGLYRDLLRPGRGGPLGLVLHQDLRARSRAERALAGAPEADLIALHRAPGPDWG